MNRFFFKNTWNDTYVEIEKISKRGYEINYRRSLLKPPEGSKIVGEVYYDPLFYFIESKIEEKWYPEYNEGFDLWKLIK